MKADTQYNELMYAGILAVIVGAGPDPADVLRCKVDKRGRFTVSQKQIDYIKQELGSYSYFHPDMQARSRNSKSIQRVLKLVHSSGITVRYVLYNQATDVTERMTKEAFRDELVTRAEEESQELHLPLGYFGRAKWTKKRFDTWLLPDREGTPPLKYRPLYYISLWCKDGRLWIRKLSHGNGEGE